MHLFVYMYECLLAYQHAQIVKNIWKFSTPVPVDSEPLSSDQINIIVSSMHDNSLMCKLILTLDVIAILLCHYCIFWLFYCIFWLGCVHQFTMALVVELYMYTKLFNLIMDSLSN